MVAMWAAERKEREREEGKKNKVYWGRRTGEEEEENEGTFWRKDSVRGGKK